MQWITQVLLVLIFALSSWGLVLGIRSLKREGRGLKQWTGVGLNGLILIGFFLLVILLFEAIRNFN